jgi:hypothetical protein
MKYKTRITQRMNSAVAEIYYIGIQFGSGTEISVNSKYFGPTFGSVPREKDFIKAQQWLDKQMSLLNKYSHDKG